jgi:Uma2 family endonuclease
MQAVARVPLDHPATYDDLLTVPDLLIAEILDGELYASPRPAPRYLLAESVLGALLMSEFGHGRGGLGRWFILDKPEVHLVRDVLVRDIAGWRHEHMPRLPDEAWFPVAPDWVCEVLSPSTATIDSTKKLRIYARQGVGHAWLVDPIAQTLEVLRLEAGSWVIAATYAGAEVVRAEPFDLLELELQLLWRPGDLGAPTGRGQ